MGPASVEPPTLARKLGIGPGTTAALLGAPRGFTVPDLPGGARLRRGGPAGADVVLLFVRQAAELPRAADMASSLPPGCALWVAWPRRAAGHRSDVTDQLVRTAVLPTGLVDVKVAAIGEDWSGLRFVHRRSPR